MADAYAIQQRVVAGRLTDGARIVGWKIGLTSLAMQQQLGVDQPDYGPILDGWLVPSGGSVDASALIAPRVEAEIAFILRTPLRGPGVTTDDVRAATEAVAPAIEVIDSRIADWKLTLDRRWARRRRGLAHRALRVVRSDFVTLPPARSAQAARAASAAGLNSAIASAACSGVQPSKSASSTASPTSTMFVKSSLSPLSSFFRRKASEVRVEEPTILGICVEGHVAHGALSTCQWLTSSSTTAG